MINTELRYIHCPDLEPPALPDDPTDCEVAFQVVVGLKDSHEEATFRFSVVTPSRLQRADGPTWGRGKLIVGRFEWSAVAQAIAGLLARCTRPTWPEVVAALARELPRESEVRRPTDA